MKRSLHVKMIALAFAVFVCMVNPAASQDKPASPSESNIASVTNSTTTSEAVPGTFAVANLYFYRHRRYEGAALKPSVYVDDKELARMDNGRFFVARLEPGKHSIRSNDKSSGVDIDMKAGTDYYVRVDMQTGFWKGHGRLTLVMPEQGSYEVKQTKPLSDGDVRNHDLVAPGSK